MEDENEVVVPETTEEVTPEVTEEVVDNETPESDDVSEQLAKAKELAENYKVRAEKAEKAEKKAKEAMKAEAKVESKPELSSRDTIAIINAKIHEDDIEDVLDYAKYKGITVAEALKSNVVKASIAQKAEERDTAEATNTGKTRSGTARVTGESLILKAQKTGEIPDSDTALEAMLNARYDK